jgi:tetratricopeptide (TPR) repeat protein
VGKQAYKDRDYPAAIDALTRALNQPSPPVDAQCLRARAFLRLNPPEYRSALEDFLRSKLIAAADPLPKTDYGKAVSGVAYCLYKVAEHAALPYDHYCRESINCYDEVIRLGFAPAVHYNNKGYVQAQLKGESESAAQSFTQAIKIDSELQAAYHNRAKIDLQRAYLYGAKGYVPDRGISDIKKALSVGPANLDLYHDAFYLNLKAADALPNKQGYLDQARESVQQLIDFGWLTRQMANDPYFKTNQSRLGIAVADIRLKDRQEFPPPQLFLDPVQE